MGGGGAHSVPVWMGETDAVKVLSIGLLTFTAVGACVVRMVWTCRRVRQANEREGGSRAQRQAAELRAEREVGEGRGGGSRKHRRNRRRGRRRGSHEQSEGTEGSTGAAGGETEADVTADGDFALALQMQDSSEEDDVPMAMAVSPSELRNARRASSDSGVPPTGDRYTVPPSTAIAIEMAREQRERRALAVAVTMKTTHKF